MNGSAAVNKLSAFASAGSAFLKRIKDPLWRLLSFSLADERIYPARTLSSSLEKGSLSVAYGTRFLSRMKIQRVRAYSFEEGRYPQPEVVASSLALAINDFGTSNASVSLGIPKAWTFITTAEFPAAVKDNLPDVITYELDRLTPFSAEDCFYDFRVLNEAAGKISVLVAAAKTDLVRPYVEALKEKGITLDRLAVNLSGFETLCRYMDGTTDRVFLEIQREGYEGALFMNGAIAQAFSGHFPGEDEQTAADAVIAEITPLLDELKQHGKAERVTVFFRDLNSPLKELLKVRMRTPLETLNEKDLRVNISGDEKRIPYDAIGGALEALWLKTRGLNLSSKGRHEQARSPKALTFFLGLSILAFWILYLISPLKIEEKRLQEIDRQISLRKEEVKKVEALKGEVTSLEKEVSTIKDFKESSPMALDILKELTTILPKNTWLSRVRITQTTVEVEGYATSATGLLPKLEASPFFKKAEFASPTFRDTRMNSDRFNVKLVIEGVQELKTEGGNEGEEE